MRHLRQAAKDWARARAAGAAPARATAARAIRRLGEDFRYWLIAEPSQVNRLDVSNVERFYETGEDLIEAIVGAIACGQHVALAGPRGCGKSHCIGEAIDRAIERGLVPAGGKIKLQGNKELPRDYLIEDDVALKVRNNVVIPERKDAPLFKLARRDEETGLPETDPKTDDHLVIVVGEDGQEMRPDQRLVLFLDEVNRFSDGVLDSLLLLLEEGEAILAGKPYKLRIVVLMTMNPPGYDASARTLSPPLSSRIGRQYRLLSPQISVVTDTIAPPVIDALTAAKADRGRPRLAEPNFLTIRRAAAATLCCWGHPETKKPGLEYLSADMRRRLTALASLDEALAAAMRTLSELCHFGPDARALIDWVRAAAVAATNDAASQSEQQAEIRARHFLETAITVLAHKVQDGFSAASRPDNTRRKEEAIHIIAQTLLQSSPNIDTELERNLDDDAPIEAAARALWGTPNLGRLRRKLIQNQVADDDAVQQWLAFIVDARSAAARPEGLEDRLLAEMRERELVEQVDATTDSFCSEAYRRFCKWLAKQTWQDLPEDHRSRLAAALRTISQQRAFPETIYRYLDRMRCVQDEVYESGRKLGKEIGVGSGQVVGRARLCLVADCVDLFWIRAEHYGEKVLEQIDLRLQAHYGEKVLQHIGPRLQAKEADFDAAAMAVLQHVLRRAAARMAGHKKRGLNTRRAMRALNSWEPRVPSLLAAVSS